MIHCSSETFLEIIEMAKGAQVLKSQKQQLGYLVGILIILTWLLKKFYYYLTSFFIFNINILITSRY